MSEERIPVTAEPAWPDNLSDEEEAVVSNWFYREGRTVQEGEPLVEIQVEKTSVELIAPVSGTLDEILIGRQQEFRKDDVLAYIKPD